MLVKWASWPRSSGGNTMMFLSNADQHKQWSNKLQTNEFIIARTENCLTHQFTYCVFLLRLGNHRWGFMCRFYPRPVLAFGYCRCLRLSVCPSVRVCGNHLLVRTITHHPFTLGSPNLDHRCKRPWLRSLLFFWGWLTLTFKVKFNFKVKIYPILSLSVQ